MEAIEATEAIEGWRRRAEARRLHAAEAARRGKTFVENPRQRVLILVRSFALNEVRAERFQKWLWIGCCVILFWWLYFGEFWNQR